MEAPELVNSFQFEIIKKEPVNEDEISNQYESNFHPVKQEYYSKPELNLDWDEKYNVDGIGPENIDWDDNAFFKMYNPRVLLERLPDSVLTKYFCPTNISLKTEQHQDDTETSSKFFDNVSAEADGENCALRATNFSNKRVCSECQKKFKNQLSLQHHLLYCGKLPHLQCSHCPYKTKYKSALKIHTSNQHSAEIKTIKKSFEHSKSLRSLNALKSDAPHCYKNTVISCKSCTVDTKNKTGPLKDKNSKTKDAVGCPKCNKKFKYKKSLMKHLLLCNGSLDSGNKQSLCAIGQTKYFKKQVVPKKIKIARGCPKCSRKFKYKKSFKQHLIKCKSYSQCKYCTYSTKHPSDLVQHVSNAHINNKVHSEDTSLVCSICKKQLKSQYTLKVHLRHCGQPNPLQSCPQCGKLYGIQDSLKRHLEVCGREPRYECKHCSYKSHWKTDVTKHTVAAHLRRNVNQLLPCSSCSKRFKNQRSLSEHLRNCGREPRFQCDYCSHKTKWKTSLAMHIVAVHLEKDVNQLLPCSKCGKRCKTQQSLNRHELLCRKERHLQCDYCSYKTNLKASLEKHMVAVHLEKEVNYSLPCSKCGKKYKNKLSLSRHSYFCGKESDMQCDVCPYKTYSKSMLKKHIVARHLEIEMNYFLPCLKCNRRYRNQQSLNRHKSFCGKDRNLQCDYCSYKTCTKGRMERHILAVHLEKEVNYSLPCSKCGKRYKNHQSLITHRNVCGKEPHLQCDHCPYKTKLKPSMKKHVLAVHLEKEVNYFLPCSKCGKRYKNQQSLITHEKLCGKEPHLQCDHCPYKTNLGSSMKKHILAVHLQKGVNYFLPCSKCGKTYKTQLSLSQHSYYCGKEPRWQCDHCPYKTYFKDRLKKHALAVHVEKDVNYFLPCSKCGKRYKNKSSLSRHSSLCGKKHHLRCDNCSYTTNSKSSLEKHIIAVHVEKNINHCLPCSKCGGSYKNYQSLKRHSYYCGKEHDFRCDYCSYKTNLKHGLKKHIVAVHLKKEMNCFLPCLKCGKKYKNRFSLSNHLVYCGKKPSHKCQHCSYVTHRKATLAKHTLQVHDEKHKSSRGWSKYKNK